MFILLVVEHASLPAWEEREAIYEYMADDVGMNEEMKNRECGK
jgi:hypothetical protein